MATEQERNRALVLQMYDEVWNKGNLGFVNVAVSPKFQDHPSERFYKVPTSGREAISEAAKNFRAAMPDFHDQMIQIVSEGDRVYYLGRITGTQTAPFFQVPASGKKVNVTGIIGNRYQDFRGYPDGSVAYAAPGSTSTRIKIVRVPPCAP